MLSLLFYLFFGLAWGQESGPEIRIPVNKDAKARTFPKIHDTMVEVRVEYCTVNLEQMLDNVRRDHIRSIAALNIGEESWLLRITLTDEDLHIDASVADGFLELWVRDEEAVTQRYLRRETISTKDLLQEKVDTGVSFEPEVRLRSLYGSALANQMSPRDITTEIGMPAGIEGGILWDDIDEARKNYLEAKEMGQEKIREYGDTAYVLGWGYLAQGLAAEAGYYFNQLQYTPGGVKPSLIYLSKAKVALLTEEWSEARDNLYRAYMYGADEATVVEMVAFVSQKTGIPNRAKTGRLLAFLTSRPELLLLAGELLQMDGFYAESKEVLEPLYVNHIFFDEENIDLQERLALRLGDAYLNESDLVKAKEYWISASEDISALRFVQVKMLEGGAIEWVKSVPELKGFVGHSEGQIRAEALYLIGQVYSEYGTQLDGIELWADFTRTFPEISKKTDVVEMLWSLYRDRIMALNRIGATTRIAKTHEMGWIPELRQWLDDPEIVTIVARAYEDIGLSDKALDVLTHDFGVGAQEAFYSPEAELFLAELYFRSDHYYEALRTLEILKSKKLPAGLFADARYLEAQVLLAQGDLAEAQRVLEYTSTVKRYRTESYLALGILARENDDCYGVVSYLRPILLPYNKAITQDTLAYLYLAQCLAELGEEGLAQKVAVILEDISVSKEEIFHARYLQAHYGKATEVIVEDTSSTWNELIDDLQDAEEFDSEYQQWLTGKK